MNYHSQSPQLPLIQCIIPTTSTLILSYITYLIKILSDFPLIFFSIPEFCLGLQVAFSFFSLISSNLYFSLTLSLSFVSFVHLRNTNQYFCRLPSNLRLSCSFTMIRLFMFIGGNKIDINNGVCILYFFFLDKQIYFLDHHSRA